MRFWLLDRIETFVPHQSLTASKFVSYSEDYLEDHFPEFPVLPGVFMLEAATQAGAWLLRLSSGMAHSVITLKQAKNLKYANFVSPGKRLMMQVEQIKQDDRLTTLKVEGSVEGATTMSGRIVLERYNPADTDPRDVEMDERVKWYLRKVQKAIVRPDVLAGIHT